MVCPLLLCARKSLRKVAGAYTGHLHAENQDSTEKPLASVLTQASVNRNKIALQVSRAASSNRRVAHILYPPRTSSSCRVKSQKIWQKAGLVSS